MTYLYEYKILDDTIKVEYVFSSVTESIKVIDMWVDDKPPMINELDESEGRGNKLMVGLDKDLENRICGTYDHSIDVIDPDEPTDLPGKEVSYLDSLLTTGFDNEPTETEWLEQRKIELALGV